jgi:hypothetical protein
VHYFSASRGKLAIRRITVADRTSNGTHRFDVRVYYEDAEFLDLFFLVEEKSNT